MTHSIKHGAYLVDLLRTADEPAKHTVMEALTTRNGHKPERSNGHIMLYDKCVSELYSMVKGSGQPG